MNTRMRNMTLTAAALAALTVIAPKAGAQEHARGGDRGNAPRQESRSFQRREAPRQESRSFERREAPRQESRQAFRGNDRNDRQEFRERGYGAYRGSFGYGRAYVAPRPVARYAYGYAAPFRIFSGFRFYSACPGPDYVYIANYGWVEPPFFGAVWIPGHYDIGGYWVDGFWR